MDPNQNAGSFMSAVAPGAGQALKNALARRGITTPGGTNQSSLSGVLPSAPPPPPPTGALPPQLANMPPQAAPSTPPPPAQMPTPQGSPAMPGQPPLAYGNPESQLILKAMTDYLKHIQDVNETQQGVE